MKKISKIVTMTLICSVVGSIYGFEGGILGGIIGLSLSVWSVAVRN